MTSIAGCRWRAFGVILSALGAVAPDVGLAQGQHQNANLYAFYDWTGGPFAQNLEQETLIKQKAAASYWAMIWNMDNASPAAGGYTSLQTDGNRFDSTRGDAVIFSIWGSKSFEGASCGQFPYESAGTGYSCRLPYPINVDRWYRLRVWKLSSSPAGVWWGAWILDGSTGADTFIGKLKVSPGKYRFVSTVRNGTKASGTTGSVTDVGKVKTPLGPNNTIRVVQSG